MDRAKKQAIVDKLCFIAANSGDMGTFFQLPDPKRVLGKRGVGYVLSGAAYREFDEVCRLLLSERSWGERFSTSFVESGVHRILDEIVEDADANKALTNLDAFVAECERYSSEHVVYLPVDGIVMQMDSLPIGRLTLVNMAGRMFDAFQARSEQAIREREGSNEAGEHRVESWRGAGLSVVKGRTVVEYRVVAEPERARTLAEEAWRPVADLLRYFVFSAFLKRMDVGLGLRGDVRYGVGQVLVVTPDFNNFTSTESSKSPRGLVLSPAAVEAMRMIGVFIVADMLKPGGETAFTPTLLRGIHWVADALTQAEPATEFLSLVSCLETFLTREVGDSASISNAVAVGAAWVLGVDDDERRTLRKRLKGLYDKRSKVSHGGDQEALARDLPWLRDLVLDLLQKLIARSEEFRDSGKAGLHEWIEEAPVRRRAAGA